MRTKPSLITSICQKGGTGTPPFWKMWVLLDQAQGRALEAKGCPGLQQWGGSTA